MNTKDYRLTIADFNLENSHYRIHNAASLQTYVNVTNPFLYDEDSNNTVLLNGEPAEKTIIDYFSVFNPIKNNSTETGILPPGVKFIGSNYLVFEKPPTFKNIFYVPTSKYVIGFGFPTHSPLKLLFAKTGTLIICNPDFIDITFIYLSQIFPYGNCQDKIP